MNGGDAPLATARHQMWTLLNGFRVTQCLAIVATLGVADLLADGPQTAEELAARTGAHAGALYRVLRALASVGVFEELAERRFTLTPLAAVLRADHPSSMRAIAIISGREPYQSWAELMYSVRTGAPAFDHVYGEPHFDYLTRHPEASAIFDQSMSASSRQATSAIVGAYDFAAVGTVADVGGGQGTLLAAVLRAHPALRGILFDQPHVVAGAEPVLAEAGVADRCARVGGDFFATAPSGANLYLLRRIIHDWDDEHAITVLRNCARAMGSTGKVLVIESVIEAGNEPSRAKFLDLQMLVMNGGRERTAEEYQRLFAAAGLRLTRIIPTGTGESLIEGERALGGG